MVFEIIEEVSVLMNGFQKESKIRFNIDFSLYNKTDDERIYIINKEKINTLPIQENVFLQLIEELENLNYPIKIKTDYKGHFLEIEDHEKWLMEWNVKADKLIENFHSFDKAKEVKDYYYELIKDKDNFTKNKFKEPYWNLFFFNPPIDNVNLPDIGTVLNWNIRAIGVIPCVGRTTILNPGARDIIISFDSYQRVSHNIIDLLKPKISKEIKWDEQTVKLHTESHFDNVEKKMKKRSAYFQFFIKEEIKYTESVAIVMKN
ncbi:conserved hypothetical protein [Flavobacterium sp. 9AF]|uniref:hypothetical protein n=1 Tax=Flavobacterium sp. 9AF TaxID=2653142 RepID=UPI0012F0067E|nr:hypothetical protein [Flavobacterium sp. 9AF]VXB92679.1 conserved hypothetical protein [Flavobacterium sp. 9AF]